MFNSPDRNMYHKETVEHSELLHSLVGLAFGLYVPIAKPIYFIPISIGVSFLLKYIRDLMEKDYRKRVEVKYIEYKEGRSSGKKSFKDILRRE